jgi:type I restriction enzyme R subunit
LLQACTAHGEDELSLTKLATSLTAKYGSMTDAKKRLGDPSVIRAAFIDLQRELYSD